jgi:hypothetical protein
MVDMFLSRVLTGQLLAAASVRKYFWVFYLYCVANFLDSVEKIFFPYGARLKSSNSSARRQGIRCNFRPKIGQNGTV